jgi:hypothetical protein
MTTTTKIRSRVNSRVLFGRKEDNNNNSSNNDTIHTHRHPDLHQHQQQLPSQQLPNPSKNAKKTSKNLPPRPTNHQHHHQPHPKSYPPVPKTGIPAHALALHHFLDDRVAISQSRKTQRFLALLKSTLVLDPPTALLFRNRRDGAEGVVTPARTFAEVWIRSNSKVDVGRLGRKGEEEE